MTDITAATTDSTTRRKLLIMATAAFCGAANLRACDLLLPEIARDYGVTVGTVSWIVTAYAAAYGLFQLVLGPLGDRTSRYRMIALASIGAGIATTAGAVSEGLGWLVALRALAGAVSAAIIPVAFAWIGDAIPYERRQAVLGRFISGQIFGIVFGQAIGGLIADAGGWRMVFISIGALHVIAGLAMLAELRRVPESPPAPAGRWRAGDTIASMIAITQRPLARLVLISGLVEAVAMFGAMAFIGSELAHRFGISARTNGLILACYAFGALLYSTNAARWVAALGESGLARTGGAVLAGGLLILAFLPVLWLAPVAMAIIGLGFYMIHNTLQTNATQMAPEARGLGVSLFATTLFAGQSVGVALAAIVVDRYGASPVFIFSAIALAALGLWFARARVRIAAADV